MWWLTGCCDETVLRVLGDLQSMSFDSLKLSEGWREDALRVGAIVYAMVPNGDRPSWAAGILSKCCEKVGEVPTAVQVIPKLAVSSLLWSQAHSAFGKVRQMTLVAEREPTDMRRKALLYVAENAAKVIYNATGSQDAFDRDSGAWLVRCSKEFADLVEDESFTTELWRVISDVSAGCPSMQGWDDWSPDDGL